MGIDFARGAATQIGTTVLRKVAGGIGQVIKSRQPSPTSPIESTTRTKYSTKNLSFPLDIGEDPGVGNHGHYIIFFINLYGNNLKYPPPEKTYSKLKNFFIFIGIIFSIFVFKFKMEGPEAGKSLKPPCALLAGKTEQSISMPNSVMISNAHFSDLPIEKPGAL